MAKAGSTFEYFTDPSWITENNRIHLEYTDVIRGRARTLTVLLSNPQNARESTYVSYKKIRVTEWRTGKTIFVGRVNSVEPQWNNNFGQVLKLVARDFVDDLFERYVTIDYSDVPRKRSTLISQIISDYTYPGNLTTDIDESGSSETVEMDYSGSNIKASEAIDRLAREDPWDDTPTGYGYDYWVDDSQVFHYKKRGTRPAGGPLTNGLTLEYRGTAGDQTLPVLYDYNFPTAVKETITRVTVRGTDSNGAAVSHTETDSNLESSLHTIKELIDELYGVTDLTYCQTRAKALLSVLRGEIIRATIKIVGFPRYKIDSTSYTPRAGELVRVKCSPKSIDQDFMILEIKYVEPEGIATLKLLSTDFGWAFSPFELESIFSGIYHEQACISARIGPTPSTPPTPTPWSADNITPAVGINPDGSSYVYFVVEIPRVEKAVTYDLQFRVKNASSWELITVDQVASGNPTAKTPSVKGGETYEFRVRSHTLAGIYSDWSAIVEKAAIADTTPPGAPTNFTVVGGIKHIVLNWTNPVDADLSHIVIRASDDSDWNNGINIAIVGSDYFVHTGLGVGITKYYWIRAVDLSGNEGPWEPSNAGAGEDATTVGVVTGDIADFAIDASKLWTNIPVVTGGSAVWHNNDPSAGYVKWDAHYVYYDGVEYSIVTGNSNKKYIYWKKTDTPTTYHTTDTNPSSSTLTDDGFVIAVNISGTHDLAWNSIANQIIGNAYISDLNAVKITAGDIAVARITAQGANAVNAGVISIAANRLNISGETTFAPGYDPSDAIQDVVELLISNASSGQKDVVLEDSTAAARYDVGDEIELKDDSNSETCEIASIASATLTMVDNLTNSYTVAANAKVTLFGAADNINNGVTTIDGGKITTNTLDADRIKASTITSNLLISGSIKTATTGSRLELTSVGIKAYNGANQRVQILNTGSGWLGSSTAFVWDASGNVSFAGTLKATNIEAGKTLTVNGTISAGGGKVTLGNNLTFRNSGTWIGLNFLNTAGNIRGYLYLNASEQLCLAAISGGELHLYGDEAMNIASGANRDIVLSSGRYLILAADGYVQIAGNFQPQYNSTYNLGSIDKQFDTLYVDTIDGGVEIDGTLYIRGVSLIPSTSNFTYLGTSGAYWFAMYANYVKYKNLDSFQKYDDIGLLRQIKAKRGTEKVDIDTVPNEIKDESGTFIDAGNAYGLAVGAILQQADKLDALERKVNTFLDRRRTE